jgi:hypothetical protein
VLARAPVFGAAAAVLLILVQHTCAEHAVEHAARAFALPLPARGRDRRGCGVRLASEPDFQELRKNALRPGEAILLRVSMLEAPTGGRDADPPAAAACASVCVRGVGGWGVTGNGVFSMV